MEPGLSGERVLAIIETQKEVVSAAPDLRAVMGLIVCRARDLVGADAAAIEMLDGGELVYQVGDGTAAGQEGLRLPLEACLAGRCIELEEVLYSEDVENDVRVDLLAAHQVEAVSMACLPLRQGAEVVGVLEVHDRRRDAFDAADLIVLELLCGMLCGQLAYAEEQAAEAQLGHRDPLTGLPNRADFDRRMAAEAARARRHGNDLAICLLDVDGLHRVNETLGESVGDEVLRAIARHLEDVRGEDDAFRIGGDEFALLLAGTDELGALIVAERLKATVAADAACQGVSISCGVAVLDEGDPATTLEFADASLYEAKHDPSA